MDQRRRSKGKGLDQSTPWSEWIWNDERRYWYCWRTDPTGQTQTEYRYPEPEPANRAATPRTPGPTDSSIASSQEFIHSPPIATSNDAYTTSQTNNFDQDATPTASYTTPATIHDYYNSSSSTSRNCPTIPSTDTSSKPWSNNTAWSLAGNVATFSVDATTRRLNTLSLATPRAAPPTGAFNPQVAEFLANKDIKHIYKAPNTGDTETLDHRYIVNGGFREQDDFWKRGRVFMMLWTEPAGQSKVPMQGGTRDGSHLSTVSYGQQAYSEIRRFVVVKKGHGSSICCPIHTYSYQATLKPNLPAPKLHTIIYTSRECPALHSYEVEGGYRYYEELVKDPIQVISERNDELGNLDPLSRLNYNKVYTVEHYVRALNIGMVSSASMPSLLKDSGWGNMIETENEQEPRRNLPPKKSSGHDKHRNYRKKGGHS